MSLGNLAALIAAAAETKDKAQRSVTCEELAALREMFIAPRDFKPGDFVTQIEGLQIYTEPNVGNPAIVLEMMPEPILNPDGRFGSTTYRSVTDMIIGFTDDSHTFNVLHVDSRRFEHYVEPSTEG